MSSGTTIQLDYEPQPKQQKLHDTTHDKDGRIVKQILYGGAAGGGKSHSMRWDAYECCLSNPGLDAYLFRRTRVELENTHIKRIKQELPAFLGAYNETKNRFQFVNGSYLNCCYAEHEKDVEKYNSVEFHWLGIDEATHFTPYQIGYLKTRMRVGGFVPVKPMFPRMIMSANPGGPSHNFLKELFLPKAKDGEIIRPEGEIFYDETMRSPTDPNDPGWPSIFISAKMVDNAYLDEGYDAAFGNIPEWKRKMLVDGDWDVIPGAYFECWNSLKHVIDPFPIPDWWNRFYAVDWGHATPFWIGLFVVSDGHEVMDGLVFPEDALICVWEWYGSEHPFGTKNLGIRLSGFDFGQKVIATKGDYPGVADPSMWRTDSGKSAAERAFDAGLVLQKADNQREMGWQEMYNRIDADLFYSFRSNVALNTCIPSLIADPMNPEDVLKKGMEDHPGDGCRYGMMARPVTRKREPTPDEIQAEIYRNMVQREVKMRDMGMPWLESGGGKHKTPGRLI